MDPIQQIQDKLKDELEILDEQIKELAKSKREALKRHKTVSQLLHSLFKGKWKSVYKIKFVKNKQYVIRRIVYNGNGGRSFVGNPVIAIWKPGWEGVTESVKSSTNVGASMEVFT